MSLLNVAVIALLAVAAPLVVRAVPRTAAIPVIVVEILLGLAAGPHGLEWFSLDAPVNTLALLGVTFLFFLAGLEVDLRQIRGRLLARSLTAYVVSLGLAVLAAALLDAAGLIEGPLLVGVAFSATGLGLVIPILRDGGLLHSASGALAVGMASVAEFAAVIVLAVAFSTGSSPTADAVLLLALVALAVVVTVAGERVSRYSKLTALVDRLSGGPSSCGSGSAWRWSWGSRRWLKRVGWRWCSAPSSPAASSTCSTARPCPSRHSVTGWTASATAS